MIRTLHNRLTRLERRFVPAIQRPNFLIEFVDAQGEITGTLTLENGERKEWYAPGHEPCESEGGLPRKTQMIPGDPR